MGCDINMHTEVKIEGKWRHWGTPKCKRYYRFFEKLAGVRGDIVNAISAPKGIPQDATFETLFDYSLWEGQIHSASWLGAKEIKEVYKWWATSKFVDEYIISDQVGYCLSNEWDDEYIMEDGIEDIRWIFWFDN